jgi:hypothetical protein
LRTAEQNLTKLGRVVSCEVLKSCPGLSSLVLNYIKDCQSILEEVVSADRTKNNNKMAKLSN